MEMFKKITKYRKMEIPNRYTYHGIFPDKTGKFRIGWTTYPPNKNGKENLFMVVIRIFKTVKSFCFANK
jgi:hypothetical protein